MRMQPGFCSLRTKSTNFQRNRTLSGSCQSTHDNRRDQWKKCLDTNQKIPLGFHAAASLRIAGELEQWAESQGVSDINELVGAFEC